MRAAQETAKAMWEAESYLRLAMQKVAEAMAHGAETERRLGLSPSVSASPQAHAAAALARICDGQSELAKAHKLAERIAHAKGLAIQAGSGGTKGGSDAEQEEANWNPLAGILGATSAAEGVPERAAPTSPQSAEPRH